MSQAMNKYEYIDVDTINDELKCIICLQPFQSPVTCDCKHTFGLSCIDIWTKQNASCPTCRHQFETRSMFTKMASDSILKQLDDLLIRCLKCDKNSIQRADFEAHYKRCSNKRLRKISSSLHKRWHCIKTTIRATYHGQTAITTTRGIVDTNHEQRNSVDRLALNTHYRSYHQLQSPSHLSIRSSQGMPITTTIATGCFEELLPPLTAVFLQWIIITILSFLL